MTATLSDAVTPAALATTPATAWDRCAALVVALLSAVVLAVVVPIVGQQWAAVPAFIPAYQAAIAVNDLVTAALLFGQFREHRRPFLLLGGGYIYTACLVVAHILSFPGLFAPSGLIGGPQATVWLWLAWHVPFPLLVAGYALAAGRVRDMPVSRVGTLASAAVLVPLALAGGAALLATAGHDYLPALLNGNRCIPGVTRPAVALPFVLSMLALAVLAIRTRLRSALDLWLAVAMGAWTVEILLSAVLNSGRSRLATMSAGCMACSLPSSCWFPCC